MPFTTSNLGKNIKNRILLFLIIAGIIILAIYTRFGIIITPTTVFVYFTYVTFVILSEFILLETFDKIVFDYSILLFVGVIIVSSLLSIYKYGSLTEILRILSVIFTGIALSNVLTEKDKVKVLSWVIISIGLILSAVSYLFYYAVEFAAFPKIASIAIQYAFVSGHTISSLWQYQNSFAGFLTLPFFIIFAKIINERKDIFNKVIWIFAAVFILFIIILTNSRGGAIALLIGFILFLIFYKEHRTESILYFALIVAGAFTLAIFAASPDTIMRNFYKTSILFNYAKGIPNSSLQKRVYFAKFVIRNLRYHPLLGFGPGTFQDVYAMFNKLPDSTRFGPHSIILRFIIETGVVGFAGFAIFILRFWIPLLKKSLKSLELYIGIFVGLTALFVHTSMDIDYPDTIILVILFASLIVLGHKKRTFTLDKKRRLIFIVILSFLLFLGGKKAIGGIYAVNGLSAVHSHNTTIAKNSFYEAIKFDSANDLYHYYYASFFRDLSNADMAISQLKKASSLRPTYYQYPLSIGQIFLDTGKNEALTYLRKAEILYPSSVKIKGLIAFGYIYLENNEALSEEYINKALKLNPLCSNAYVAKGFCFLKHNELQFAKGCFVKAVKIEPRNPYAQLGLLYYYKSAGDYKDIQGRLNYIRKFDNLLFQYISQKSTP